MGMGVLTSGIACVRVNIRIFVYKPDSQACQQAQHSEWPTVQGRGVVHPYSIINDETPNILPLAGGPCAPSMGANQ